MEDEISSMGRVAGSTPAKSLAQRRGEEVNNALALALLKSGHVTEEEFKEAEVAKERKQREEREAKIRKRQYDKEQREAKELMDALRFIRISALMNRN